MTPATISGASGIRSISAGSQHTCAVTTSDTVRCFGDTSHEQLGSDWGWHVLVNLTGVSDVTAGTYHTCATRLDGTAVCWGAVDNFGTPVEPPPVAVASGDASSCALRTDGTVRCWGSNWNGKLGNGSSVASSDTAVPVSNLTGVVAIDVAWGSACAVLADGSVWCWGNNQYGQLGEGSSAAYSNVPVQIPGLEGVSAVSESRALLSDKTVKCWGDNSVGQVGPASTAKVQRVPVTVEGLSNVRALSAGGEHRCVLLEDGSVWCWGLNTDGELGNGKYDNGQRKAHRTPQRVVGLENIPLLSSFGHAVARGPRARRVDGAEQAPVAE